MQQPSLTSLLKVMMRKTSTLVDLKMKRVKMGKRARLRPKKGSVKI